MVEERKTWNIKPILTKEEEEKFQLLTNCEICDCIYTRENTKVRHHQWDAIN